MQSDTILDSLENYFDNKKQYDQFVHKANKYVNKKENIDNWNYLIDYLNTKINLQVETAPYITSDTSTDKKESILEKYYIFFKGGCDEDVSSKISNTLQGRIENAPMHVSLTAHPNTKKIFYDILDLLSYYDATSFRILFTYFRLNKKRETTEFFLLYIVSFWNYVLGFDDNANTTDVENLLLSCCSQLINYYLHLLAILIETIRMILDHEVDFTIESENELRKSYTILCNILDDFDIITQRNLILGSLSISKYRKQTGIDYSIIGKKELAMDKAIALELSKLSDSEVQEMLNLAKEGNILELQNKRHIIYSKLDAIPDGILKNDKIAYLDSVNEIICELLTDNSAENELTNATKNLKTTLGTTMEKLTVKTIKTLRISEMLFVRFTKDDYSSMKLDYSFVSGQYYQAIESMLRDLLWVPYFDYANYLKRNYYKNIEWRNDCFPPNYKIDKRGTLGSFHVLLQDSMPLLKSNTIIRKGLEKTFGRKIDSNFEEKLRLFVVYLEFAAKRRNTAAHSNETISLNECIIDRSFLLSGFKTTSLCNDVKKLADKQFTRANPLSLTNGLIPMIVDMFAAKF